MGRDDALVFTALLIGAGGYNIYSRDGLEFRLKGSQLQCVKFNTSLYYEIQCRDIYAFARNSFCLRGDYDRPPTVALVGDSHAMNLYAGLGNRYAKQGDNLVLFGTGGGIPFYGVERIVNGHLTAHYAPLYAAILDEVIGDKNIRTVILMNKAPSLDPAEDADLLRRPADLDDADTLHVYATAMDETLRKLVTAGKQVIVVLDSPAMDFDPGECISRIANTAPARRLCAISRQHYEAATGRYRRTIQAVAAMYPNVKLWDLADLLCDREYCWAMRDAKMLYARDGHHLTMDASYWLAERFNPR